MTKQEALNKIKELHEYIEQLDRKSEIQQAIERCGVARRDHKYIDPREKDGKILLSYPNCNNEWTFSVWDWARKFIEQNQKCYIDHDNALADKKTLVIFYRKN